MRLTNMNRLRFVRQVMEGFPTSKAREKARQVIRQEVALLLPESARPAYLDGTARPEHFYSRYFVGGIFASAPSDFTLSSDGAHEVAGYIRRYKAHEKARQAAYSRLLNASRQCTTQLQLAELFPSLTQFMPFAVPTRRAGCRGTPDSGTMSKLHRLGWEPKETDA